MQVVDHVVLREIDITRWEGISRYKFYYFYEKVI